MTERGRCWLIVGLGLFVGCGGRSGLPTVFESAGFDGALAAGGSVSTAPGVSGFTSSGSANAGSGPSAGSVGVSGSGSAGTGANAGRGGSAGVSGNVGMGGGGGGSAGRGGNAGAGGASATTTWFVDPVDGSDRNPGSFDAPLKTLERAAAVASGGDTVWLFDGTYQDRLFAAWPGHDCSTGSGVTFAANVQLKALHSGLPRLLIAGAHGLCLSGGALEGLHFECQNPGGHAVEVSSGIEGITGSTFTNCGSTSASATTDHDAGLDVSGDALVQLIANNSSDYSGYPNYTLAAVRENATLTVYGGTVSSLHRAFAVSDSAVLSLHGVDLIGQDPSQQADQAIELLEGMPTLILSNSSIDNFNSAIRVDSSSANLSLDNCTITSSYFGLLGRRPKKSSLNATIINSHFASLYAAVFLYPFAGSVQLSLSRSDFNAVERPLMAMLGGTLSLEDVSVSDCDFGAVIAAYTDSAPLTVSLRRVNVTGCRSGGLSLSGSDSTIFDLGTSASAGGNVLRDNQRDGMSTSSNLFFGSSAPILISAIGNSWTPNTQGTDENGQCSVAGSEQTFELTSANGPNFVSGSGNKAVLRLAEKAP